MEPVADHRWSGFPGAWCLDCGEYSAAEACIAAGDGPDPVCENCGETWPMTSECPTGDGHDIVWGECENHPWTTCPEPNSRRHDPYAHDIIDLKDIVD